MKNHGNRSDLDSTAPSSVSAHPEKKESSRPITEDVMRSTNEVNPSEEEDVEENMAASRKAAYDEALQRWIKSMQDEIDSESKLTRERNLYDNINDHQLMRLTRSKEEMNELKKTLDIQMAELQRKRAEDVSSKRTFEPSFFLEESPFDKERAIANRNSRAQLQLALAADISDKRNRANAEKVSRQEEERKLALDDLEQYRKDCEHKRMEKIRNMTAILAIKAHEDQISMIKKRKEFRDPLAKAADGDLGLPRSLLSPIRMPTLNRRYDNMSVGYDSRQNR